MIELVLLYFFAKSVSAKASAKGHPGGTAAAYAAIGWIGGEIGGAVVGAILAGTGGAIAGALLGAVLSVLLVSSWVDRLPQLGSDDQADPSRFVSQGDQLVGKPCVACETSLMTLLDARYCPTCYAPVHADCAEAHRDKAHPEIVDYRSKPKRARKPRAREVVDRAS